MCGLGGIEERAGIGFHALPGKAHGAVETGGAANLGATIPFLGERRRGCFRERQRRDRCRVMAATVFGHAEGSSDTMHSGLILLAEIHGNALSRQFFSSCVPAVPRRDRRRGR
jgi:hypothetical protein